MTEPVGESLMEVAPYPAGGKAYVARTAIGVGTVVAHITTNLTSPDPTKYTIQVAADRHIDAEEVRYLNHSCLPNTYVDTVHRRVVAIRPIERGEILTFFYPATEWTMASPFLCRCGHEGCLATVSGAAALPAGVLSRYAISDHIRELAAERDRAAGAVPVAG